MRRAAHAPPAARELPHSPAAPPSGSAAPTSWPTVRPHRKETTGRESWRARSFPPQALYSISTRSRLFHLFAFDQGIRIVVVDRLEVLGFHLVPEDFRLLIAAHGDIA